MPFSHEGNNYFKFYDRQPKYPIFSKMTKRKDPHEAKENPELTKNIYKRYVQDKEYQ